MSEFKAKVDVYTTTFCPYCVRAKSFLESKGVSFTEHNLGNDPDKLMALKQRTGMRTVPQIFIGDRHVGGSDELVALEQTGDLDAWIEAGRRSAPAVEAVAAAPPRPVLDKAPLPSVLDKADEERLAKAYADKLLGCDAHDAPAWVRAAAAADDAGAAAACCASALPASEGSLEKADLERLSKAYADKIACDEPYPYAARGVDQDRAPYTYADDDAAETEARAAAKILLLDACDDDAAKERLREKGFALADDDDVAAHPAPRARPAGGEDAHEQRDRAENGDGRGRHVAGHHCPVVLREVEPAILGRRHQLQVLVLLHATQTWRGK